MQHEKSVEGTTATITSIAFSYYYYDENNHNNNSNNSEMKMKTNMFVDISQPLELQVLKHIFLALCSMHAIDLLENISYL